MPTEPELLRLFDRSPIGMYRSDAQGRLLLANPALVKMLGYATVDELLALDIARDVYADAGDREPVLAEYAATGFVEGRRVRWKTRSGRVFTVQLFGHVVDTATGLVFDASVIDRTSVDALDEKLRMRSEAHHVTSHVLDAVLSQMPALYWMTDRDLRVTHSGGATDQIVGWAPDTYVGVLLPEIFANVAPTTPSTLDAHRRALAGEVVHIETEVRGKLLASVIAPYRNGDNEIIGAVGTSVDVTAHRALERRMVDAQRAESLGVLAGGLAHDFNNLLVAILGNADLALREVRSGQPGHGAIDAIRVAGLRAAELTDQLLTYAGRGGAGTVRVEPALILEELLRILGPAFRDQVRVTVDMPARLAVRGDPGQLRQVLLNLINNARDAIMPGGGVIMIRGEALHSDGTPTPDDVLGTAAGSYVVIEVADTGPGLDGAARRHVFEPFFTTKQGGHGLGLAAALGIVRAHGGGIRVVSAPGQGARFQVLWPAAATAPIHAVHEPSATRTVLVIDDEDLVRDVVARMVEDLGYAAVTAADGKAGLDLLERQEVDAVLVDLSMPHMNGTDVVAAVRERRPHVPVVVCSGYDRDSRGTLQADAFLPKPFRMDALERTLAKLLPLRSV